MGFDSALRNTEIYFYFVGRVLVLVRMIWMLKVLRDSG